MLDILDTPDKMIYQMYLIYTIYLIYSIHWLKVEFLVVGSGWVVGDGGGGANQ